MNSTQALRFGKVLVFSSGLHAPALIAQPANSVVFAHGAAAGGEWGLAMSVLRGMGVPNSVAFTEPFNYPTKPVAGWRDPLVSAMNVTPTTLLIGHSLGGVAARHATAQRPAAGILTVGSPHGGLPLANALPSALSYAFMMASYCQSTANLIAPGAAYLFNGGLAVMAFDLVTWLCPSMLYALVDVGTYYIYTTYPPDFMSLAPGSSFLSGLPSNQPTSVALRGIVGAGHQGGPLALVMEPAEADDFGQTLVVNGLAIMGFGASLDVGVDWDSEHALRTHMAAVAAQEVGWNMIAYAQIWCTAVTTGQFQLGTCSNHDGFVPTASQGWAGAQTFDVGDAVHTKQAWQPEVLDRTRSFICAATVSCSPQG